MMRVLKLVQSLHLSESFRSQFKHVIIWPICFTFAAGVKETLWVYLDTMSNTDYLLQRKLLGTSSGSSLYHPAASIFSSIALVN